MENWRWMGASVQVRLSLLQPRLTIYLRFLDKPIPAQDFPTGNSPEVLIARHAKYFEKNVSAAKRNFGIFILCLGLVVAYLVQRFFY